jgi:hypothetical protein
VVWSFKCMIFPDWFILKWKAWLDVHGGKHGVNYWDTHVPVVNWSMVHLVFIMSLLNNFHTWQIDFVQAFTQAPIDCPIHIEVPAGFQIINGKLTFVNEKATKTGKTYVLKLLNMYGLKQAGNNWYNFLWCLTLQSIIALSTMEAENISLSQSMRGIIPLKQILVKLSNTYQPSYNTLNNFWRLQRLCRNDCISNNAT